MFARFSAIEDENDHMKDIGFDIYSIKDKDGTTRSFISFTKMFAVEASRYEADFTDLHKACKAVKGHIAMREDFDSEEDYKKVLDEALKWRVAAREDFGSEEDYRKALSKFGAWMARTTVGRSSSFHMDPIKDCGKDKLAETNRKHWNYYDGNGSALMNDLGFILTNEINFDQHCEQVATKALGTAYVQIIQGINIFLFFSVLIEVT
ncbi:hypothetical protein Y032_0041g399 [Ancylostoma ceylanicum]|uniref:Uncharacterized protein n=1 Tax=Ancylostoma ceylanicum TaxID=53326 RepID=A0A016UHW3_9BILA|nr:hypothetical protein Y032_0041g399 [Ancylostoma ceylanicum]